MPRPRPGYRQLNVEVRNAVGDSLDALLEVTGRNKSEEVEHALERHVAQPPTVRQITESRAPKLKGADVGDKPEGRRRRKRK
jgi:hypothetical protein